jgi:general stress protein 26
MMKQYEEPLFIDVNKNSPEGEDARILEDVIRRLLEEQPFAVLATQGKGITNASLISFAKTDDLKHIVFATPINSGKFDLIDGDENVSILVDDRSQQQDSINQISALTITGKARILRDKNEITNWAGLLTGKYPNLTAFVKAPNTAVILVEVVRFFYVSKFQEVQEFDPTKLNQPLSD